jgi:hypothetical protein
MIPARHTTWTNCSSEALDPAICDPLFNVAVEIIVAGPLVLAGLLVLATLPLLLLAVVVPPVETPPPFIA